MSWFLKASNFHVKLATLFTKLDDLSGNVSGLANDLKETIYKVGRLEGHITNSNNPEILRQVYEINSRLTDIEVRLSRLENQKIENPEKKLKQISGSTS
tara:strand:+ start:20878 stop:21174 length:297 start_codon:yes stop_codon:yes gene_type:complete